MDVQKILENIEIVTETFPLKASDVEIVFGVPLCLAQGSNEFFTVKEGRSGTTRIEVREPTSESVDRGKYGMLLVELRSSMCSADLDGRFGRQKELGSEISGPHSQIFPIYHVYTRSWGELRLGLDRGSGYLREVVIDANM